MARMEIAMARRYLPTRPQVDTRRGRLSSREFISPENALYAALHGTLQQTHITPIDNLALGMREVDHPADLPQQRPALRLWRSEGCGGGRSGHNRQQRQAEIWG
jgi:hypothetical protein